MREIITGRPRPRHLRFAAALAQLVPDVVLERRDRSRAQRLRTNLMCRLTGIREAALTADTPTILHQAVTSADIPHLVEYDVPLALHGYSYEGYLRHRDKARRLLERPAMRGLIVFSEWAKRSFALHFGEETGAKCAISYPLAYQHATRGGDRRTYDFTFISLNFRIKAGPEVVRAFQTVRNSGAREARLCMVTNLAEARAVLGDLDAYPGIEWRQSDLDERAIAALLSDTHCLVHPSLWESFGVVVLEALAAGCAVICSDMASFPELVTDANGIRLKAPIGLVVGDMTIPEFNSPRNFGALLQRLDLRAYGRDLTAAMTRMADPATRARYQEGSWALYERTFSPAAWSAGMRPILKRAFPDLHVN